MKTGFRHYLIRARRNIARRAVPLALYGFAALALSGANAQAQDSRSRFGPQSGGALANPLAGQGSRPAPNGSYQAQVGKYNVTATPLNGGGRGNGASGVGMNGSGYVPNRSVFGGYGNGPNGMGYGYNGSGYGGLGYNGFSYGPGYNNGGYGYPYNSGSFDRFNRSSEGYPYRTPQQYTNDYTKSAHYITDGIRSEDYLRGTQFRYTNGVYGRGTFRNYAGFGGYFPGSCAYYPYYQATYSSYGSYYSPYSSYYGVFPPYISSDYVSVAPPEVVYVPYPVYVGDNFSGYRNVEPTDDYYLNRKRSAGDSDYEVGENSAAKSDRSAKPNPTVETPKVSETSQAVSVALADIRHAWENRDIQEVAKHTRRDTKIAVYLRGKYQYSLSASDYLDLTRDAFRATTTVRF